MVPLLLAFVNLYYEFNNYLLDFVAAEKSNLKCAAYSEVYGVQQKTNYGGQQSYPPPGPPIYIQVRLVFLASILTNLT